MNFHDLRAGSLRAKCPDKPYGCGAPTGTPCVNMQTGQPLESRPAHERRMWNADALGHLDHLDLPATW